MLEKGNMIGQGNTAEIYDYGEGKILKLYREGIPDFLCMNEFNNTKTVNRFIKIAPKAYEIVKDNDRAGAVYEKVIGKTMLKIMIKSAWKLKKRAKEFANYHLEIQKEVDGGMMSVKDKLKDDIEANDILTDEEKNKVLSYLSKMPDGNKICHFDFHPDNIIISKDRAYVIDWMTGCIGDSNADVARTCILLKYGQVQTQSRFVKKIITSFQKKLYKYYIEEYLKISNQKLEDIEKWIVPVAAARLREWIPQEEKNILVKIVRNTCSKILIMNE